MCVPTGYILRHDGYRLVERRHNPEKWVNVDVTKERPDGSLVGCMLNVNRLKVRYDLRRQVTAPLSLSYCLPQADDSSVWKSSLDTWLGV